MSVSPDQLTPQPPKKDKKHHIIQQPQNYAEGGPQRIQIITKQGHEIILFDTPSGHSKIQITTSDGGQQIILDEQNKKFFIGIADTATLFQIETDGMIQIKARGDVYVDAPNIHLNCDDYDKAGDLQPSVPPKEPKGWVNYMELDKLLKRLFEDIDFGMIKFKKNPENEDKFLFDFFINLNEKTLLRQVLNYYKNNNYSLNELKRVIKVIKSFKGKIYINPSDLFFKLSYEEYQIIKEILDEKAQKEFKKLHLKNEVEKIKRTKQYNKEDLEFIKKNDLDLFIDLSVSLRLNNPEEIYNENPEKVFDYINRISNQYFNLKKLNKPLFVIKNMNSRLRMTNETIKYFLEECPLTINLLIELRKQIPFPILFDYAKHKMDIDMIKEIIWTKQDLNYFLNNCERISYIDNVLKVIKEKYPHFCEMFKR